MIKKGGGESNGIDVNDPISMSNCANMWCWTSIKLYLISLEMMCCSTLNTEHDVEQEEKVVTIYL